MRDIKELANSLIEIGVIQRDSSLQDWAWVVRLSQSCERAWNQSGRQAARALAQESTDLPTLRRGLLDGNELVRTKVLHLLSLWNPSEVIKDLNRALEKDPCPVVRHEAAYFLGMTHDIAAVEPLTISMVNDENELVRHEAAEAIGELGLSAGIPRLAEAHLDASDLVRKTAEIAMENIRLSQQSNDVSP